MKDLREVWEHELLPRLTHARYVAVLTDFDGTLTPLVERPDRATLDRDVRELLRELSGHPRVVLAVVSGRSLADVSERVGLDRIWYVANHGYEIRAPWGEERRAYDDRDLQAMAELKAQVADALKDIPGVIIEDKGPIVAVHFRLVDPARVGEVGRAFHDVVERHHRTVMMLRGHLVFEMRVRSNCNKGTAVRALRREMPHSTLPIYFGDDITDRDAFRELRGVGVSVQVGSVETPLADYILPDPLAVTDVLGRILAQRKARDTRRPPSR